LDGRHLGVVAGAEPDRTPTCAAAGPVAGQVNVELSGDNLRLGDGTSCDDVVGWWTWTTVLCGSQGEPVARTRPPAAATAIVAPVLEN
jgi:hypothetical protein